MFKCVRNEVEASKKCKRYTTTKLRGQSQPYQDIDGQYEYYLKDGYKDIFFQILNHILRIWEYGLLVL